MYIRVKLALLRQNAFARHESPCTNKKSPEALIFKTSGLVLGKTKNHADRIITCMVLWLIRLIMIQGTVAPGVRNQGAFLHLAILLHIIAQDYVQFTDYTFCTA